MDNRFLAIIPIIAILGFVSCQKTPDPVLSIGQTEYSISGDGGSFSVNVNTNVEVSIKISDGWIRQASVSPDKNTYSFTVACNDSYGSCDARTGNITFANSENGLLKTVTVHQEKGSILIAFKDQAAKDICVKQWDSNRDGELSEKEASSVKNLQGDFSEVSSFDELKYFTSLKTIPDNFFNGLKGLVSISFPEGLETIGNSAFINCTGLSQLIIPNSVKSIGNGAFGGIPLSRIDVLAETPPTLSDNEFSWIKDECLIYVPAGKAPLYQEAEGWRIYGYRITEEGHSPFDFLYASTDYSKDGEVVCLQKASEGAGINLIFLGDGFLDKDMETGGKYETVMRKWMEQFFVYEPYKTFRNWFSVYTVKVVSKHGLFGSPELERKLTRDTEAGETDEGGNRNAVLIDVCNQYAGLVPNPNGQENKVCVFLNIDNSLGRSWCDWYSDGSCLGVIFESIEHRPTVVNHELGGHGFAFLDDEYSLYDKPHPNAQEAYENAWQYGMLLNLDWRSDPEQVRWSRFLKDPRYSEEGLGVFEGGGYYSKGVFRPTENSMMRMDYAPGAVFNAPSREAIYRHIMRMGIGEDWTFDYDTFVEADAAGRKQAAASYSEYISTRSSIAIDNFEPGLPPIFVEDGVKEICVSKEGKVSFVR
ncbi:MAG: leucine-rich repeat protein [Bacteroidales bacterium]|nr:leucine-rich repeat protein [Bacteroidales bacterium]